MAEAVGLATAILDLGVATVKVIQYIEKVREGPEIRHELQTQLGLLHLLTVRFKPRIDEATHSDRLDQEWSSNAPVIETMSNNMRNMLDKLSAEIEPIPRSRLSRLKGRVTMPLTEAKCREILEKVHQLLDMMQMALAEEDNMLLKDLRSSMQTQQQRDLKESIFKWIPTCGLETKRKDLLRLVTPGTGQWFLDSPEFQRWQGGTTRTLWCPGIPGAGKSIMASIVMNHLQQRCSNNGSLAVAGIFFDHKDEERLTLPAIYGDVLSQLLRQLPDLPQEIEDWYMKDHEGHAEQPAILRAIEAAISGLAKIYIVIDALDECHASKKVVLGDLLQLNQNVTIIVTSRKGVTKDTDLESWDRLEISATSSDIQAFVRDAIAKNEDLRQATDDDPELGENIVSTIIKKADTMFLLARLNVEELEDVQTENDIKARLQALPDTLDAYYDKAIQRIQAQSRLLSSRATQVLTWLLHTTRPLELNELRHALAVRFGDKKFDKRNLIINPTKLTSTCAGLAEIDSSKRVRLVHYSVAEYLRDHPQVLLPEPAKELAGTCLTYLNIVDLDQDDPEDSSSKSLVESYPFLMYAAQNWGHHLRGSAENEGDYQSLALSILRNPSSCSFKIRPFTEDTLPHPDDENSNYAMLYSDEGLHVAAGFGLTTIVANLIRSGQNPGDLDYRGMSALHFAAAHGWTDTARWLLDNGARTCLWSGDRVRPLNVAVVYGRKDIVDLFIRQTTDLESLLCPEGFCPALSEAVKYGRTDVVETLLRNGASINVQEPGGDRPLHTACHFQRPEIVRVLYAHGARFNSAGLDQAIIICIANHDHNSLREILTTVPDVNKPVKPDNGMSDNLLPLDLALTSGDPGLIEVLLGYGAKTALSYHVKQPLINLHRHAKWFDKLQVLCGGMLSPIEANPGANLQPTSECREDSRETSWRQLPNGGILNSVWHRPIYVQDSTRMDSLAGSEQEDPPVHIMIPDRMHSVQKIIVTTDSHDQGFSDLFQGAHGTYHSSYTWFDMILQFNSEPNHPALLLHVQSNINSSKEWKTHVNVFDVESDDPVRADAVWRLRAGDTLKVYPRATFRGWVNYVRLVKVEVHGLQLGTIS